ncbi:MAG: hypothetical protein WDM87_13005 [Terracidiphilus sp.]
MFPIKKISQKGDAVAYPVYDFTDNIGKSVIVEWRTGLTARSKGALDSKLNMLAVSGTTLPPRLLAGPIKKTKHIYKLIIHADVMLRPMLCKGPFEMDSECTLLIGAKEIQWKLIPGPEKAVENRNILLNDKTRRKAHAW